MFKPVSPKVDFPKLEQDLLKKWYEKGIVEKYLHRNDSAKQKFSFLDGPITANNPMGVHHAWGRTYKDLWQRFWNMRGYRQRFQNGFDEQGLWVEVEVEKELGLKSKKDIENLVPGDKFRSLEKFINLCKERVKKYSAIQTEQSKRLGYFMDWENSYHTSSDENNYAIWNFLKVVNGKGWLYKGHDTVPWCPRCGTAISQHEILTEEYKEIAHETVYFKLPVRGKENEYLLVWTTTPWTIPGNVAVAVNPKEKYVIVLGNKDEKLWVMEKRINVLNDVKKEPIDTKTGAELIGREYDAPFDKIPLVKEVLGDYVHRVIDGGELVTETEGTGLLHVAPGAGEEDFKLGKENSLPVIASIEEDASYVAEMGEFAGRNAKKHPELIIDYLKSYDDGKYFLATQRITHRYPTCWRCKTELVWRVVDEWYIGMDKKDASGKTYREQMIEVAKKIKWMPKWGLERELDWLKNMHDWLISKKRYWGLALPIWECQECHQFKVIGRKEELKHEAIEGWKNFEGHSPHRPWIDQIKIKCEKCGAVSERIPDVGNPWLDAGIVPFSTLPGGWFPADFVTESFPGQFKNWFYSLIAMSTALKSTNPTKTILGHAAVRDEKGEEMHKSKGNAIEFNEAADKIGVDVMRWLYITADPEQNLNFGYHAASEIRRHFHLMFWNIYNFFVTYATADKWEPNMVHFVKRRSKSQNVLDRWILSRLHETIKITTDKLENYNAYIASREIERFVEDLSLWYVRRSRDRVGPAADNQEDKEACYQALYQVLVTLSKLLAPFTPFIADEIYTNLAGEESVHLEEWPNSNKNLIDEELEKQMNSARLISSGIHELRKENKIKVKIPLRELNYSGPQELNKEILELVLNETNVYNLRFLDIKDDWGFGGEVSKTNQDLVAGQVREIIRKIQDERKKLGTKLDEKVNVILEDYPGDFEDYIKKNALVQELKKGKKFSVGRL